MPRAWSVVLTAGSMVTYVELVSWRDAFDGVSTVMPLGAPHGSADRRRAVGQTIGALMYLQVGYRLVTPCRESFVLAILLWVAARLARRLAPEISGS